MLANNSIQNIGGILARASGIAAQASAAATPKDAKAAVDQLNALLAEARGSSELAGMIAGIIASVESRMHSLEMASIEQKIEDSRQHWSAETNQLYDEIKDKLTDDEKRKIAEIDPNQDMYLKVADKHGNIRTIKVKGYEVQEAYVNRMAYERKGELSPQTQAKLSTPEAFAKYEKASSIVGAYERSEYNKIGNKHFSRGNNPDISNAGIPPAGTNPVIMGSPLSTASSPVLPEGFTSNTAYRYIDSNSTADATLLASASLRQRYDMSSSPVSVDKIIDSDAAIAAVQTSSRKQDTRQARNLLKGTLPDPKGQDIIVATPPATDKAIPQDKPVAVVTQTASPITPPSVTMTASTPAQKASEAILQGFLRSVPPSAPTVVTSTPDVASVASISAAAEQMPARRRRPSLLGSPIQTDATLASNTSLPATSPITPTVPVTPATLPDTTLAMNAPAATANGLPIAPLPGGRSTSVATR